MCKRLMIAVFAPLLIVATPAFAQFGLCYHRAENDFARAPADPIFQLSGGFTLEMWLRPDAFVPDCALLGLDTQGCNSSAWSLSEFDNDLRIWLFPDNSVMATDILVTGEWQHVAVSWRQGTGETVFYHNGVPFSTGTNIPNMPAGDDMVQIGGVPGCGSPVSFEGMIDEVRIWNRVRTPDEIFVSQTRELTPTEIADPTLVGYWQFNEGTGQGSIDITGRGNHVILGGSISPELADPDWCTSVPTSAIDVAAAPPHTHTLRIFPNPVAGASSVALAASGEHHGLTIYSPAGQVIRHIDASRALAQESQWVWDLHDQEGHHVAKGAYFAQVDFDPQDAVKVIVH